jgi:hypothetical protein
MKHAPLRGLRCLPLEIIGSMPGKCASGITKLGPIRRHTTSLCPYGRVRQPVPRARVNT